MISYLSTVLFSDITVTWCCQWYMCRAKRMQQSCMRLQRSGLTPALDRASYEENLWCSLNHGFCPSRRSMQAACINMQPQLLMKAAACFPAHAHVLVVLVVLGMASSVVFKVC